MIGSMGPARACFRRQEEMHMFGVNFPTALILSDNAYGEDWEQKKKFCACLTGVYTGAVWLLMFL